MEKIEQDVVVNTYNSSHWGGEAGFITCSSQAKVLIKFYLKN
jgi:hypothetical protein